MQVEGEPSAGKAIAIAAAEKGAAVTVVGRTNRLEANVHAFNPNA